MMEREYQYLISGLPNISPEDTKTWISIPDFRNYLEEHLHQDDFFQVRLLFLKHDRRNIIKYLETGEINPESAGNFTTEDFNDRDNLQQETGSSGGSIPPYMAEVLLKYGDGMGEVKASQISHELENGFYGYIMSNGCTFLKRFIEFDYNLNNLLTFIKARQHKIDQQMFISGDSSHAQHLHNNPGKNIVKDHDFEHFDEIISFTGNPSFAEEEKRVDLLRWNVIEEMILFRNFSIDRVLGYLLQMLIIDRWSALNRKSGEKKLRNILIHSNYI
ncbi:MAG: DUF2764 family protein [Bacteroidales bacterium]